MSSALPAKILEALHDLTSARSFENELPSRLDQAFMLVAGYFRVTTRNERLEIMRAIPAESGLAILERGTRLAILAERSANPELLVDSLVSHAIEGIQVDKRENILRLPLVTHIAKKLGTDDRPIFEEAARVAEPEVASMLRDFASRKAVMKTLQLSGLEEIQTPDFIDYRQVQVPYIRPKRPRKT